jgi:hypothetical protein
VNRVLFSILLLSLSLPIPARSGGPRDGAVAVNAGGSWLALGPSRLLYGYRDQVRPVGTTIADMKSVCLAESGWWVAASPRGLLIGYRENARRIVPLPEGFGEARALIDEQGWWVAAGTAGAVVGFKDGNASRLFRHEGVQADGPVHVAMNHAAEWVATAPGGMLHGRRDQLVLSLPLAGRSADLNPDGRWVIATDRAVVSGRKDQVLVESH